MRVLVIGSGLSGTIFAKTLREVDVHAEILLFEEEKYLYYPRPNLIEYVAGNLTYDRLFAFSDDWFTQNNLQLHLGQRIVKIHRDKRIIEDESGQAFTYDRLVLANGAEASIPPFQGTEKSGIFTLRTLDDAQHILAYMQKHTRVLVIGGGLLGLEIARAVQSRGAKVDVFEFFPRLLPRQLDAPGASVLQTQIEKSGIRVHLDVATESILGENAAQGLRFKDGSEFPGDMVIVAAGVRPRIELARAAGLVVDRGILVNDQLQTNDPLIYAAGDSVQHSGRIYGIIPASFQQARAAALTIAGTPQSYTGTVPSNTLKVMGIHVTSMGEVNPEPGAAQEFRKEELDQGIYKKLVVQGGKLTGAIWLGTKQNIAEINRLVSNNADVGSKAERLLEDDFDFSQL